MIVRVSVVLNRTVVYVDSESQDLYSGLLFSTNFSGEKMYSEEFRAVYFLTIREKNLNQISYS